MPAHLGDPGVKALYALALDSKLRPLRDQQAKGEASPITLRFLAAYEAAS